MEQPNNDNLKKSAFGGMIWKVAERICAQLVSLVVSIVLARILTPEDYAPISIVFIFFAFCRVFVSGGIGNGNSIICSSVCFRTNDCISL